MNTNEFDKEYYLMNVDGASNHPLLTWGETDDEPFIYPRPVNDEDLELPLKMKFCKPYPKQLELADILFSDGDLVVSEKVKQCLEKMNIYGIQFFSTEIETDKKKKVKGYYYFHLWNRIVAVDKNNYEGDEPNERGRIHNLEKFSLDEAVMENTPLEKRLVFHLGESISERLIHKTVYDTLKAENIIGGAFFRIDNWDENAMFR